MEGGKEKIFPFFFLRRHQVHESFNCSVWSTSLFFRMRCDSQNIKIPAELHKKSANFFMPTISYRLALIILRTEKLRFLCCRHRLKHLSIYDSKQIKFFMAHKHKINDHEWIGSVESGKRRGMSESSHSQLCFHGEYFSRSMCQRKSLEKHFPMRPWITGRLHDTPPQFVDSCQRWNMWKFHFYVNKKRHSEKKKVREL